MRKTRTGKDSLEQARNIGWFVESTLAGRCRASAVWFWQLQKLDELRRSIDHLPWDVAVKKEHEPETGMIPGRRMQARMEIGAIQNTVYSYANANLNWWHSLRLRTRI